MNKEIEFTANASFEYVEAVKGGMHTPPEPEAYVFDGNLYLSIGDESMIVPCLSVAQIRAIEKMVEKHFSKKRNKS